MTPKEKAKELFNKFKESEHTITTSRHAKQCALICVDKIMEYGRHIKNLYPDIFFSIQDAQYWQEVKQEIENL